MHDDNHGFCQDEFNLTLGIRAVVELEPIISEDYPEALVQCQLCRKNMLHVNPTKVLSCEIYARY